MFKARAPPKHARRRGHLSGRSSQSDDKCQEDDTTAEKLAELRQIQKDCWQKPRGVPPAPELQKKEVEEEEEEDDHWGLDAGFSGGSVKQGPDPHLEAFLNERLYEQKPEEERKEKTREDRLYEIPTELQVADGQEGAADKLSWVAGLAEVPLGVEYKLANIEATEKAKRAFLHGEGQVQQKGAVLEPDAVTRKAFGSRFLHFHDRSTDSKRATDDAVLERFRKRMRR